MGQLATLAVLGTVCAAWPQLSPCSSQPQVSVLVYDYAGVPLAVLRAAETQSHTILNAAGVQIVWMHCSVIPRQLGPGQACPDEPGPSDLVLHILPHGTTRRHTDPNAFGFALPAGGGGFAYYAGVFYDRVAAIGPGFTRSAVLGNVIAHEIGHLLLGAGRHSETGIMKSEWSRKELELLNSGVLRFSAAERRRISVSMQLRIGAN